MLRPQIWNIRRDERGFTLPEVMITIVIMGIVFAIASSTWQGTIESRHVDSATNQVASDLRLAHSNATNRLATAQIQFSSTGAAVNCGATTADYCLVRPTAGGGTESLPRNFEGNALLNSPNLLPVGGVSTVELSPNGSASSPGALGVTGITDNCPASTPTGVHRLQIAVDGNPTHCVTFNTATSRIKID